MDRMERLEFKLAALETDLHRWRTIASRWRAALTALLLAVGAAMIAAATAAPTEGDVIQTRRLEIVNANGRVLLAADATQLGGRLNIWTAQGQNVLRAAANPHGGDVNIWSKAGQSVLGAFATARGAELTLFNGQGKRQVSATVGEHGGTLALGNAAGEHAVAFAVDERGAGTLIVADTDGTPYLTVRRSDDKESIIALHGSADGQRASLSAGAERSALTFLAADGKQLFAAGAGDGLGGYVDIANLHGTRVFAAAADTDGCGRLDLANASGQYVFSVDGVPDVGSVLALFNAKGEKAFVVGTRAEGGLMNIFNAFEVPIFVAGYAPAGLGGAMSIKNGRGLPVVHAAADEADRGRIAVYDADGAKEREMKPLP